MTQTSNRYRRSPRTVGAEVAGEVTLLDTLGGQYFGLDGPGARIWELLETDRTVDGLVSQLMSEYEVDEAVCRSETLELLEALKSQGLVEVAPG